MPTYIKILNERKFGPENPDFILRFDIFEIITYPHAVKISHYSEDPEKYVGLFLMMNREGPQGKPEPTPFKLRKRGLFQIDPEDFFEQSFDCNVKIGVSPRFYEAYPGHKPRPDEYLTRQLRFTLNADEIYKLEPFPDDYPGKTISMMLMVL